MKRHFHQLFTYGMRDGLSHPIDYWYQGRIDSNGTEIDGTMGIPPGSGAYGTWRVRR